MRLLYILFFIVSLSCGKQQAPKKDVVFSIQQLSDLATVEYTVTKIIKAQDNKTWYKIGDRKILMTSEAVIKAGIDLGSITKNDIAVDGKKITVTLPPPKFISISLPPEKIKVQYEDVSGFRTSFSSSERDVLAVQAEKQIRNSIDSLGILPQAKANTALLLHNMLSNLGFEEITIRQSDEKRLPTLP